MTAFTEGPNVTAAELDEIRRQTFKKMGEVLKKHFDDECEATRRMLRKPSTALVVTKPKS